MGVFTCYQAIALEVLLGSLSEKHISLVEEQNAPPSTCKCEIGLQSLLDFLGRSSQVPYRRDRLVQ